MLKNREVAVVGAGIGGLATALAMAARGAKVKVFEQSPDVSEVGAGLQITPNGVAVLDALGLGEELRRIGVAASALELRDYRRGSRVVRLDFGAGSSDRPYLLLHRADLIALMTKAAVTAGIEISTGRAVTSVVEGPSSACAVFSDSTSMDVPLLIGADGLHSRLRPVLNKNAPATFTGQVAWRAIVRAPDARRRHIEVHMGPGRHVVTYPLRNGEMLNVVAVEEREEWSEEGWNHPGQPDRMRREFSMFGPEIRHVLGQIETVNVWGLFRHPVALRWFGAYTALVGDAAHPTLPFLAQGANMALEDAWVLAECLDRASQAAALADYQRRRRGRVVRVIEAANANARNYHLRNPAVRLAAHSLLHVAGRISPRRVLGRFDWIHQFDVTREG